MRLIRLGFLASTAVAALATAMGSVVPSLAQGWNPFPEQEVPAVARPRPATQRAAQRPQSPQVQSDAPDQVTAVPQRGWSPPPAGAQGPAPNSGREPGREDDERAADTGRGRPPGVLGELRGPTEQASGGEPYRVPPAPDAGGSIIPDRQTQGQSPAREPYRAPAPIRQTEPRDPVPGGYRPYYGQPENGRRPDAPPQRQAAPMQQRPPDRPDAVRSEGGRSEGGRPEGGRPDSGRRENARPAVAAPAGPSVNGGAGLRGREVETQDLVPVMSADGSRLPQDLWTGLTVPEVEQLLTGLAIPPRSAALHDLWRRLIIAKGTEPTGGKTQTHFLALRLAALYRSGLLKDLETTTGPAASPAKPVTEDAPDGDIVLAVQRAKALLGLGQREAACLSARSAKYQGEVPRPVAQDALLLIAYCAAAEGNAAAASLTADLAREQQMEAPIAFAVIDQLASGGQPSPAATPGTPIAKAAAKPKVALGKDVSLLDYRFLELTGAHEGQRLIERAEPALVAALAREAKTDVRLQLEAAEDAARIHALDAEGLISVYRGVTLPAIMGDLPLSDKIEPPLKRAALAQAIAAEKIPVRKARLMQTLLQEARSHTLYIPVAQGLAGELKGLRQSSDIAFFAETAVEIALAAADYPTAVSWAIFGSAGERRGPRGDGLMHWMTLIDIVGAKAYVPRGSGLKLTEEMALKGKFAPELLHRLVTVLDALEYDIPIPLWDAAGRTPQPTKGHLPETGLLPRLKTAATDKKFAQTVLLAMHALGPDGAEGAHMLALGDTIRALKLAGLEEDARRLGFEALFATWPRGHNG